MVPFGARGGIELKIPRAQAHVGSSPTSGTNTGYFRCGAAPVDDDVAWPGQPPSQEAGSAGSGADSVPKPLAPRAS